MNSQLSDLLWLLCYLLVLLGLAGYGFHRLVMIYLYVKHRKDIPQAKSQFSEENLPVVTIQLPLFNEKFVLSRLVQSVSEID